MTFLPLQAGGLAPGGMPGGIGFLILLIAILISWAFSLCILLLIAAIGNIEIKRLWLKSLIGAPVVLVVIIIFMYLLNSP
jgi:hypothetical protein